MEWVMEEVVNERMQKWKYINIMKVSQFFNNFNCQQAMVDIIKIRQNSNLRRVSLNDGYTMYQSKICYQFSVLFL